MNNYNSDKLNEEYSGISIQAFDIKPSNIKKKNYKNAVLEIEKYFLQSITTETKNNE